jgi:hypothetical protein
MSRLVADDPFGRDVQPADDPVAVDDEDRQTQPLEGIDEIPGGWTVVSCVGGGDDTGTIDL